MTGPQVLERAHAFMTRHAAKILTLILIYVAAASFYQAASRSFWFDEIFTVSIARLPTMADVWQALASAADTSPPGYYVIQRLSASLIGNEQLAFRFASVVAIPLACLCLYHFTRRDTNTVAASIAAILPLMTMLYIRYSVEARPYALMAAMLALAALAWQRASNRYGAFVLALALIAAVSAHYYSVFALLPFAAAEVTWSIHARQIRKKVWLALIAGGGAVFSYWPILSSLRTVYSEHYWAKTSVFRAIASYDEYMALFTVGSMIGFVAVLSGALLVYVARTVVPRADDPIPPDVPPANCVLALGLLWLPWISLVVAIFAGGGVAARYTIGATLGLALSSGYVAYWLGRRASAVILLCLLTAFGGKEIVFWGAEWYGRNVRHIDIAGFAQLLESAPDETADLPVVVTSGYEFVPLAYYAPPEIGKRLVSLVDPEAARQHTGTDSIELDMLILRRYMRVDVQPYAPFEAANERFLLYATTGHGDWWQSRLLRDGFALQTVATNGARVLYLATRTMGK